jgi:hypothetical protein
MSKAANTRFTTTVCIGSYPELFVAKGGNGFDPKFSITAILGKGDVANIEEAAAAAIVKKWPDGPPVKNFEPSPIKDGNERTDDKGKVKPEFADKVYVDFRASDDDAPDVVDASCQPILNAKEIYGGAKYRICGSAYGWTYGKNSGVSCYLNSVQKVEDGQPFGVGSITPEQDFA